MSKDEKMLGLSKSQFRQKVDMAPLCHQPSISTYTTLKTESTNPQIYSFLSGNLLCERTRQYAAVACRWSSHGWCSWWWSCGRRGWLWRGRGGGGGSWSSSRSTIRHLVALKCFNVVFRLDNDTQNLTAHTTSVFSKHTPQVWYGKKVKGKGKGVYSSS